MLARRSWWNGVMVALAVPVGVVLGMGGQQLLQTYAPAASPPVETVAAQHLAVQVLLAGGLPVDAEQGLALADGQRFQLRVHSARAGTLALYARNPLGQSSGAPLWSSPVEAGQTLASPMLRLEGARGLETLNVVLQDSDGGLRVHTLLRIWHV